MRNIRHACLLVTLAIVLAHSITPHHQHREQLRTADALHISEYDFDHNHEQEDSQNEQEAISFSKLCNLFRPATALTQGELPVFILLEVVFLSSTDNGYETTLRYLSYDDPIPPLVRWNTFSFRGPPILG